MIEEKMLENRIVVLNNEINKDTSNEVVLKLLYLDSLSTDDIYLYINSPGGDVNQGFAIIDCINYIKSKVVTICIGVAYSMGAILLASGTTGKRYALPNSEIMIHQPFGNASGKATDIMLSSKRIENIRIELAKIIKKNSSKTLKKVLDDMEKDLFMNPIEAKEYGIIDDVITRK